MRCIKCGAEIPEMASFCPYCGAEQTVTQTGEGWGNPTPGDSGAQNSNYGDSNGQYGYGDPNANGQYGNQNGQYGYGANPNQYGNPNEQYGYGDPNANSQYGNPSGQYGYSDPNANAQYGNQNGQYGYGANPNQYGNSNGQYGYGDPSYSIYSNEPPIPPGAKNKIAAGVLAILLGALGVHKFYLGYTKEGVITLLVTLLTLGVGAGVMEIIGIIEGILYLSKSDYEFYDTYELHSKTWF